MVRAWIRTGDVWIASNTPQLLHDSDLKGGAAVLQPALLPPPPPPAAVGVYGFCIPQKTLLYLDTIIGYIVLSNKSIGIYLGREIYLP